MDRIEEIGQLLKTQDNRMTNHPFFIVQERVRIYGIDTAYDPEISWVYADECVEVSPEQAERLEKAYRETGDDEPDGYRRLGYKEQWEYVTGCFTERDANRYVAENSHRHKGKLRVYADSLYRNPEMIALREYLMSLAPAPVEAKPDPVSA